jgi:hypothetical protein
MATSVAINPQTYGEVQQLLTNLGLAEYFDKFKGNYCVSCYL